MKHQIPGAQAGTPAARFVHILNELEARFPDPEPFSAMAPEGRYIKAIDKLIAMVQDKLVHEVTLDSWDHVARVLKEYKKKKHAQYYLHVEEIENQFKIKVFKKAVP